MAARGPNGAPGLVAISNWARSTPEGPARSSGSGSRATRKRAFSSFSGDQFRLDGGGAALGRGASGDGERAGGGGVHALGFGGGPVGGGARGVAGLDLQQTLGDGGARRGQRIDADAQFAGDSAQGEEALLDPFLPVWLDVEAAGGGVDRGLGLDRL